MKHGIYHEQYKKTVHKKVYIDDQLMRRYIYPRIETHFQSPMVNDYNLHLVGGWSFPGVKTEECLTRVLEGKKPAGFFGSFNKEQFEQGVALLDKVPDGFAVSPVDHSGPAPHIGVSITKTFEEAFNLESLCVDYTAYAAATNNDGELEDILELFNVLKHQRVSDFLAGFDYANPDTLEKLIITGLILGYPIETTVSILW